MLAPIIEKQCFGAALAFIVAGARADRVDVAPIVFGLRMDARIAVHFGGGGLKDSCPQPLGQAQHVDRAMHACLRRLHGIVLVVDRRGRAGEIVNLVDLDVEREGHIVPNQFEIACDRADARCCGARR